MCFRLFCLLPKILGRGPPPGALKIVKEKNSSLFCINKKRTDKHRSKLTKTKCLFSSAGQHPTPTWTFSNRNGRGQGGRVVGSNTELDSDFEIFYAAVMN